MNLKQATELINKKYQTYQRVTDVVEIKVNKLLDLNNFYYIALVDMGDFLVLTDIAETANILDHIPEEKWVELCKKYNLKFNDWHIETRFNSIDDLDRFISLLDEASNIKR